MTPRSQFLRLPDGSTIFTGDALAPLDRFEGIVIDIEYEIHTAPYIGYFARSMSYTGEGWIRALHLFPHKAPVVLVERHFTKIHVDVTDDAIIKLPTYDDTPVDRSPWRDKWEVKVQPWIQPNW